MRLSLLQICPASLLFIKIIKKLFEAIFDVAIFAKLITSYLNIKTHCHVLQSYIYYHTAKDLTIKMFTLKWFYVLNVMQTNE